MVFGCRPFQKADMSNPLFSLLLENPVKFWKTHPVTFKRINERTISLETLDILTKLLLVNPENRITLEQIKEHSFYKNSPFNRDLLESCKQINQMRVKMQTAKNI